MAVELAHLSEAEMEKRLRSIFAKMCWGCLYELNTMWRTLLPAEEHKSTCLVPLARVAEAAVGDGGG